MNKQRPTIDGLHTPDGYFDGLQDRVLESINGDKGEGMTMPDQYFATMQESVVSKQRPETKTRYLGLLRVAAAVIVLASAMWFFSSPEPEHQLIAEYNAEYIDYLMADASDLDLEELVDMIQSEDLIIDNSDEMFDFIEDEELSIDDLIDFI